MTKILGRSEATAEQMAAYLLMNNPTPKINMPVLSFCRLYLYIGAIEGVRGDCLFAQSCKETGFFKFNGTVQPDQNNYAGLGTTDVDTPGASFPDEATGILAQAQHAKAYATSEPLVYECLDPRYELIVKYGKLGTAEHWEELGGAWAVPGYDINKYSSLEEANKAKDSYGYNIIDRLEAILDFNPDGSVKVEEPEEIIIPEPEKPVVIKRVCIDAGHYGKYNRSPGVPSYYESEMVWKLHLLQKKYLEEYEGIEVITTRKDLAKDLALHNRGMASKGCDLFISNHSNAVGNGMNESIDYVAVYHLTADHTTLCDDISKDFANKIAPVIANTMGTKQGYKILTRQADNDRNGDGFLNDNYYGVLNGSRAANTPGLILEHSFHTNTRTVNWLLNDDNLDKLARAEASCIANYLLGSNAVKKEENSTVQTTNKVIYKVQSGAFGKKENAENLKERIIKAGFEAIIVVKDGYHKVQCGAFSKKENAENLKDKLKASGFDAIIV